MQAPTVGINGAASVEQVRIAVLGASGYTGEEVVRLLALHPNFSVAALTGESQAGKVRECSVITHHSLKNHNTVAWHLIAFTGCFCPL